MFLIQFLLPLKSQHSKMIKFFLVAVFAQGFYHQLIWLKFSHELCLLEPVSHFKPLDTVSRAGVRQWGRRGISPASGQAYAGPGGGPSALLPCTRTRLLRGFRLTGWGLCCLPQPWACQSLVGALRKAGTPWLQGEVSGPIPQVCAIQWSPELHPGPFACSAPHPVPGEALSALLPTELQARPQL